MSDLNRLPLSSAALDANPYPIAAAPATPSLEAILRARISASGPMRFCDFMAIALYEPGFGYYAKGIRQVGKDGDFFTSVSVGPLFGELLARRFLQEWQQLGNPSRWRIIECGAHDGKLAADILTALDRLAPTAFDSLEYVISEPRARLQAAQRETLAHYSTQARFLNELDSLANDPLPGIAFGNELLDALPCHIVEHQHGQWLECYVTEHAGALTWETQPITDNALIEAITPLGHAFPDGYRTEVRTCYREFLTPLTRCLTSPTLLWIDYGFHRSDYYHPGRRTGTLRTFYQHHAGENPLSHPGETDISAHVDFTAVIEAAESLGATRTRVQNQGAWLTELAREWLLSMEGQPQPSLLRQFQTLTHPAQLGTSFHVIELEW